MAKRTPTFIDSVIATSKKDIQGEVLDINGADISALEAGQGYWNDNHNKAPGFLNQLGRITKAKKIFKEEDCEDDRQRYYWHKVKGPYIYAAGYLYDDEDHPNAKAAGAILRSIHKHDSPLKIKSSVEGGIVSRGIKDPTLLAHTVIKGAALTFSPANQATLVEATNLEKCSFDPTQDELLIKSVMHLAQDNVPSFIDVSHKIRESKIVANIQKIGELSKTLWGMGTNKPMPVKSPSFFGAHQGLIPKTHADYQPAVNHINSLLTSGNEHKVRAAKDLYRRHIDSSYGMSQVKKDEDMEKGIKDIVAGAALLSNVAMGGDHASLVDKLKDKHPHLWSIAQVESAGGKNLKHPMVKAGVNAGHTAGGPWGMMPHTVGTMMKVSKKLAQKYPEIAAKVKDVPKHHKDITEFLNKNPEAAHDMARTFYNHVSKQHGGDVDKIFHSWNHGITGTKKISDQSKISGNQYVQKVKQTAATPSRDIAGKLDKALTAGYGGASAPSDRMGGSVIQTESLEGKGKDFKRITCKSCGKEQVYMKYQIKCRDCHKNFDLETMHSALKNK